MFHRGARTRRGPWAREWAMVTVQLSSAKLCHRLTTILLALRSRTAAIPTGCRGVARIIRQPSGRVRAAHGLLSCAQKHYVRNMKSVYTGRSNRADHEVCRSGDRAGQLQEDAGGRVIGVSGRRSRKAVPLWIVVSSSGLFDPLHAHSPWFILRLGFDIDLGAGMRHRPTTTGQPRP